MEKLKEESNPKEFHIWKFIEFEDVWRIADTSNIDDIAPSWFKHREKLQTHSKEYQQFINEQKREHAIETGIVERLYDLKRGITETFIKEGFCAILFESRRYKCANANADESPTRPP